jgi:hypothetical protein
LFSPDMPHTYSTSFWLTAYMLLQITRFESQIRETVRQQELFTTITLFYSAINYFSLQQIWNSGRIMSTQRTFCCGQFQYLQQHRNPRLWKP